VARVSVLLPFKDAGRYLAECLASLAGQTLDDHEVVAVDDFSTDDSRDILESARDPRVRVVQNLGRGLVAALNTALGSARGPVLARMDADDVAHPERLELQEERLAADSSVDVLGSRVRLIGKVPGGSAGMESYLQWSNSLLEHQAIVHDLLVESPLVHPSVAMRTKTLLALDGYREYQGPEDYDLWLRAAGAGLRFAKVSDTLLSWRDRADRLTRTDPRYSPERFRDRKIETLLAGPLPKNRPAVLWGAGPIGKGWARALLARGCRVAAFVDIDPKKIGQTIHGVRVVGLEGARAFEGALHLSAVGDREARHRIRGAAASWGLVEGRDLLAVA